MRQTVNGKVFDTGEAPEIAHLAAQQSPTIPWVTYVESLHRTSRGVWFIADWVNGSIRPLTSTAALEWMRTTATGYADERLWDRYGPGRNARGDGQRRGA